MITPEIWFNEKVASLPDAGRLLFIGIFSNADDDGRIKVGSFGGQGFSKNIFWPPAPGWPPPLPGYPRAGISPRKSLPTRPLLTLPQVKIPHKTLLRRLICHPRASKINQAKDSPQ